MKKISPFLSCFKCKTGYTKIIIPLQLLLLVSCQDKAEHGKNLQVVNLNELKNTKAATISWQQHKVLDSLNQGDTLKLTNGFTSILKTQYENIASSDYESDIVYSGCTVFSNHKLLYHRDSILSAGPFGISRIGTAIALPVILSQSPDSGRVTADLVLLSKNGHTPTVVKDSIDCNANPFFSTDGSKLFFIDRQSLFCYAITSKQLTKVIEFEGFNGIFLYAEPLSATSFKLFFLKDMESGKVYESVVTTNEPYFK